MNETYIQTIRGGIQHVIYLAKDHWTQKPKSCGFYYHHELYGYIERKTFWYIIETAEVLNQIPGWAAEAYLVNENQYLTIPNILAEADIIGEYRLRDWLDQKVREMGRQANRFCDKLCAAHCDKNGKVVDER